MLLVEDQGQEEGLCQGAEIVVLFRSRSDLNLFTVLSDNTQDGGSGGHLAYKVVRF